MISVEQMLKDAVESGVRLSVGELRRKLSDAVQIEPTYENPFGYPTAIAGKIDEIVQLMLPAITSLESDKVYRRMANTLRGL
jgi:hypothetical protein